METKSQRKSVGVSNPRVFAASQNRVVIEPRSVSMVRGQDRAPKRLEHSVRKCEGIALPGAMAAVFAHEVANPLSGVSIALEFVNKALENPELDIRSVIATVQSARLELERLHSLLKEFRGFVSP